MSEIPPRLRDAHFKLYYQRDLALMRRSAIETRIGYFYRACGTFTCSALAEGAHTADFEHRAVALAQLPQLNLYAAQVPCQIFIRARIVSGASSSGAAAGFMLLSRSGGGGGDGRMHDADDAQGDANADATADEKTGSVLLRTALARQVIDAACGALLHSLL